MDLLKKTKYKIDVDMTQKSVSFTERDSKFSVLCRAVSSLYRRWKEGFIGIERFTSGESPYREIIRR